MDILTLLDSCGINIEEISKISLKCLDLRVRDSQVLAYLDAQVLVCPKIKNYCIDVHVIKRFAEK